MFDFTEARSAYFPPRVDRVESLKVEIADHFPMISLRPSNADDTYTLADLGAVLEAAGYTKAFEAEEEIIIPQGMFRHEWATYPKGFVVYTL